MSTGLRIGLIVLMFILVALSALFSAAETAYSTIKPVKIEQGIHDGKRSAKLIKKHYKSFGWTLATILISNNLVNVASSSVMTYLLASAVSGGTATIISTVVVTPILVIFGELTPKILAKKYSYSYLTKVVYVMEVFNWLFFPFTYPISKITLSSKVTNTEREIHTLLKLARSEGVLEANEATLAQKALDLDSKVVKDVMTSKEKIVSINIDATKADARKVIAESGHSRIIVKDGSKYVGVLLLRSMVVHDDKSRVADMMVPLTFVSKSILVTKALEEMRIDKTQIALVVQSKDSESVVGLITIEDIVEELVGEIYDEHDKTTLIREIAHHKYISYGTAMMSDLEQELDMKFDRDEDLTVKQWIQSRITRKIKKGLRYDYKDQVVFKIIKNKNKQETLIEVTKKLG